MAQPASSYLPSGLHDGDVFRLIFVTKEGMACLNGQPGGTQIDTYNYFVQHEWDTSYEGSIIQQYLGVSSITFKCIASTQDMDASDNILPDSPTNFEGVYKLDGTKIVDAAAALWNTGTTDLLLPIDLDQTGSLLSPGTNNVWTGTDVNGTAKNDGLGQACHSCISVGSSNAVGTGWINAALVASCPDDVPKHFYAISDNITWP